MSEDENTQGQESEDQNDSQEPQQTELEALKIRANQMGLSFHPNIGLDTLKERINAKLAEKDEATPEKVDNSEALKGQQPAANSAPAGESKLDRVALKRDATKLVRVRITCMDPNKREWDGEVFCAGNSVVGSVKRYVPFDTEWHVENILLKQIRQKECQVFQTVRNERGQKSRKGKLIKAFSVEILDPLTEAELTALKQRQLMAQGQ